MPNFVCFSQFGWVYKSWHFCQFSLLGRYQRSLTIAYFLLDDRKWRLCLNLCQFRPAWLNRPVKEAIGTIWWFWRERKYFTNPSKTWKQLFCAGFEVGILLARKSNEIVSARDSVAFSLALNFLLTSLGSHCLVDWFTLSRLGVDNGNVVSWSRCEKSTIYWHWRHKTIKFPVDEAKWVCSGLWCPHRCWYQLGWVYFMLTLFQHVGWQVFSGVSVWAICVRSLLCMVQQERLEWKCLSPNKPCV